jgi:hypothetical protein
MAIRLLKACGMILRSEKRRLVGAEAPDNRAAILCGSEKRVAQLCSLQSYLLTNLTGILLV